MTVPAIVWLVVALLTTLAVTALLIGLVRHIIVLGRALGRFQREVSPVVQEISALGQQASARSERAALRSKRIASERKAPR
jgi:hypothetical protein